MMVPWWALPLMSLPVYYSGWFWARRFYEVGSDGLTRPQRALHAQRWATGIGARSMKPTGAPCWLRLRRHVPQQGRRTTERGHIYATCNRCGREYLLGCPVGCYHDLSA
jgi:hypothetical protein